MTRAALVSIAALAVLGTVATPAWAPHPSVRCGLTAIGSADYRVMKRGPFPCAFARTWVPRVLRGGRGPGGYRCVRTRNRRVPVYCTNGPVRAIWGERILG